MPDRVPRAVRLRPASTRAGCASCSGSPSRIVVLVVLFFVADGVVRAYAENRVAAEIEKNLPDDVKGDVSVHIGGASVIQQYLSGILRPGASSTLRR